MADDAQERSDKIDEIARQYEGRSLSLDMTICEKCLNVFWFEPGPSPEFLPACCCFCGIPFGGTRTVESDDNGQSTD